MMLRPITFFIAALLAVGCGESSGTPNASAELDVRTQAAVEAAKPADAVPADAAPAAEEAAAETTQPSEDGWINYGATMTDAAPMKAADLISAPDTFVGKTVKVEGEIAQVCKSMGCWLTFQHEGAELTVNMKDHGFGVDKQSAGFWCEAEGEIVKQGELYSLTAASVRMKKADKPAEAAPTEAAPAEAKEADAG